MSDQRQGVFVRIPKTASTSIESVLANAPNVMLNSQLQVLPAENDLARWAEEGLARLWREVLGSDRWDVCYTFAFVRCPYDRAVSSWQHVHRLLKNGNSNMVREEYRTRIGELTFDAFLWLREEGALTGQAKWHATEQSLHVTDESGEIMVDFLGRFEELQADFDHACAQLGIPPTRLPHLRRSRSRSHYRDYYNQPRTEAVERIYVRDFELLGYASKQHHR